MYKWDFTPVFANWPLLAQGLLNTLKVTGVALSCGLALGLVLALLRLSRHRWASWPAGFVIEVFRTTPRDAATAAAAPGRGPAPARRPAPCP